MQIVHMPFGAGVAWTWIGKYVPTFTIWHMHVVHMPFGAGDAWTHIKQLGQPKRTAVPLLHQSLGRASPSFFPGLGLGKLRCQPRHGAKSWSGAKPWGCGVRQGLGGVAALVWGECGVGQTSHLGATFYVFATLPLSFFFL
eukprot:1157067-Pelagomonas_calceolata.AAC.6